MNWESIKYIYRSVLVRNNKIEFLGVDKYKIILFYSTGEKRWETEHLNEKLHGKCIYWHKNGQKHSEKAY